ncbi:MAG: uroporphyrinogen-III synthase [Methylococcales bacterium]|nr:uroporphyrinogen-III synthase [Methylococcales bacterium]
MSKAAVLITRPEAQNQGLLTLLAASGYQAIAIPALTIVGKRSPESIEPCLANWQHWDLLIFVSVNAVNFAWPLIGGKMTGASARPVAAIGAATAKALKAHGVAVRDVPATGFDSEALLAMPGLTELSGRNILLIRGEGGREHLAETLYARGAKVTYLEVYRRCCPVSCPEQALITLAQTPELLATLITSAQSLNCLETLLPAAAWCKVRASVLMVFSERIARLAKTRGFTRIRVTALPSDEAVLNLLQTLHER